MSSGASRRKNARMRRSQRQRVIERDGLTCYICGRSVRDDVPEHHPRRATLDHVVAVCEGGETVDANLRVCCYACNQERGRKQRRDREHAAIRWCEVGKQRARDLSTLARAARVRRPSEGASR